ncbi:MAG: hypothetical protein IPK55_10545 [Streptococcus sp.]|nr:hypothetical protein [Streptococcus sp.]
MYKEKVLSRSIDLIERFGSLSVKLQVTQQTLLLECGVNSLADKVQKEFQECELMKGRSAVDTLMVTTAAMVTRGPEVKQDTE